MKRQSPFHLTLSMLPLNIPQLFKLQVYMHVLKEFSFIYLLASSFVHWPLTHKKCSGQFPVYFLPPLLLCSSGRLTYTHPVCC